MFNEDPVSQSLHRSVPPVVLFWPCVFKSFLVRGETFLLLQPDKSFGVCVFVCVCACIQVCVYVCVVLVCVTESLVVAVHWRIYERRLFVGFILSWNLPPPSLPSFAVRFV